MFGVWLFVCLFVLGSGVSAEVFLLNLLGISSHSYLTDGQNK